MKLTSAARTDIGRRRQDNQDHFLLNEERALYAVCDGLGGEKGGETASQIAVITIEETMERLPPGEREALAWAIRVAGRRIHDVAQDDPRLRGMGTTVVALEIAGNRARIAHVGDSRALLVREGIARQLTEDHSLVAEQLRLGIISEAAARTHRWKHVILRSLGYHEDVEVDRLDLDLRAGDVLVLASDGLTNLVQPAEIARACQAGPAAAAEALVALANERGGDDNITVVIVRVDELDPQARPGMG